MTDRPSSTLDSPGGVEVTPDRSSEWRWRAIVGATHMALFTFVAYRGIFRPYEFVGPNLMHKHSALVPYAFDDVWSPATPGYLFRFASHVTNVVIGASDYRVGALLTCAVSYAAFGVALYEAFRRTNLGAWLLSPGWALVASVVIALLESPAAMWGWSRYSDDRLFLPLYLPFVPTTLVSLALNLFLMLAVASLVGGRMPAHRAKFVPLLVLAAALAKPTLLPVLTFAAVVVAVVGDQRSRRLDPEAPQRSGAVIRLVALPAAVVMAIQLYTTIFLLQYDVYPYDDRGGWSIVPFEELRQLRALTPLFFLALLLPIGALALLRVRLLRDQSILLVFVAMVPALAMALLLARNGNYQGDMLQPLMAVVSTAVILIIRRMIELQRDGSLAGWEVVVSVLLLAPYVLAGATSYSCHIGAGCPSL